MSYFQAPEVISFVQTGLKELLKSVEPEYEEKPVQPKNIGEQVQPKNEGITVQPENIGKPVQPEKVAKPKAVIYEEGEKPKVASPKKARKTRVKKRKH